MSNPLLTTQPSIVHQFTEQLLQMIGNSHALFESETRIANLTAMNGRLQAAAQTLCSLGGSSVIINVIGIAIAAFGLYQLNAQVSASQETSQESASEKMTRALKYKRWAFTALSALGLGIVLYSTFSTAMAIASAKSAVGFIAAAAV